MYLALLAIIILGVCFFIWINFMKNKEFACFIANRLVVKHTIDLLDDTVCLRKISIKLETAKIAFYRIYSFDYNRMDSHERFRGYIVLRNGKLDESIVSEFEKANVFEQKITENIDNVIKFDD